MAVLRLLCGSGVGDLSKQPEKIALAYVRTVRRQEAE
jgi:hypothetical protein